MSTVLVKRLIEAGVHFGHRASRWNPKMRPYIYGRRNLIHIIDVRETIRGLLRARKYLQRIAAGDFGRCAECGSEIESKRLDAVPWASHCIRCEQRKQARLV